MKDLEFWATTITSGAALALTCMHYINKVSGIPYPEEGIFHEYDLNQRIKEVYNAQKIIKMSGSEEEVNNWFSDPLFEQAIIDAKKRRVDVEIYSMQAPNIAHYMLTDNHNIKIETKYHPIIDPDGWCSMISHGFAKFYKQIDNSLNNQISKEFGKRINVFE